MIEIIITLVVIATLATIAVPNYMSARAASNEGAALATLRSVSTAQFQFRSMAAVDRDGDGQGEHGGLGELSGGTSVRGTAAPLRPALLPLSLDVDGAGRTSKAGYWFALYLPDTAGIGLAETVANNSAVDADLAEVHWTCLAWPTRYGASGVSTFFVNEQGELRKNRTGRYSGTNRVPPAGAALLGTASPQHIAGEGIATNQPGADGESWLVVQ